METAEASQAIGELVAAFFAAFTNEGGSAPVDTLYDLCLPGAAIVTTNGDEPAAYTLPEFVEPRRALLASGEFTDFREYETSGETTIRGHLAQRISRYEKSWHLRGVPVQGAGTKMFSFVHTPQGWKIASLMWQDDARCGRKS